MTNLIKKHKISIRVDDLVKEVIQTQAQKENRSMSNLIENLIIDAYEDEIERLRKEKGLK
ncbi:MAG: ribbon-helix-helix protein, CopG family [Peptoniphilus harei]|nr:ribbon-helix-helix protein, CopG family [Peptoniphilus harei]